jgi:hypothetical protein
MRTEQEVRKQAEVAFDDAAWAFGVFESRPKGTETFEYGIALGVTQALRWVLPDGDRVTEDDLEKRYAELCALEDAQVTG